MLIIFILICNGSYACMILSIVYSLQGNIAGVISTVQANKITEDSTQAVQGLAIRWVFFVEISF